MKPSRFSNTQRNCAVTDSNVSKKVFQTGHCQRTDGFGSNLLKRKNEPDYFDCEAPGDSDHQTSSNMCRSDTIDPLDAYMASMSSKSAKIHSEMVL